MLDLEPKLSRCWSWSQKCRRLELELEPEIRVPDALPLLKCHGDKRYSKLVRQKQLW